MMPHSLIEHVIAFLKAQHFVFAGGDNEESEIKRRVLRFRRIQTEPHARAEAARTYHDSTPVNLEMLRPRIPFTDMKEVQFLIVGGCLTQFAADALEQLAPSFGIRAKVDVDWPERLDSCAQKNIDVVIFQPSTTWFLGPLWDDGVFVSDSERAKRLHALKTQLRLALNKTRSLANESLLLVQGFSQPSYSPLGRSDFRNGHSYYELVYELNRVIIEATKDDSNAIMIDEERILSGIGKLRVMDHAISTFAHHAPIDFTCGKEPRIPSREETFGVTQACHAPRLFAEAYLKSFIMWSGIGRIKCVVVDLDNTLWPGVAGESGFDVADSTAFQTFKYGVYGGIHQALKILKVRGILLAVCSRNNERDVQLAWERLGELAATCGLTHVLRQDDFVIHRVNWERKSAGLAAIMTKLGVSPDATLFIDDSPVERAEVEASFPHIRTLGSNLNLVRSSLLDDPCLDNNVLTPESQIRTDMVKAHLVRDEIRGQVEEEGTFLQKLNIRLKVCKVRSATRMTRIVELFQRTNQFNTTLIRYSASELRRCLDGPHNSLYTLDVTDRFTSYGLVGACLLCDDEVDAFVLSCRIIPLHAEVPFLCAVLKGYARAPVRGSIICGPRNEPCRRLFRDANFEEVAPGKYVLSDLCRLPLIESGIYSIELIDEPLQSVKLDAEDRVAFSVVGIAEELYSAQAAAATEDDNDQKATADETLAVRKQHPERKLP